MTEAFTAQDTGCADDLAAVLRTTLARLDLLPPEHDALAPAVMAVASEAYRDALVQGLCCDGALEVFVDTATREARRAVGDRSKH